MSLSQQSRFIAIDTALGPDVLGLRSVSVQEHLSRLFEIDVELTSEDGNIDFNKVVGSNATIRLNLAKGTRYFNGYISRFVQVANYGGYAHYHATLVPWLWFLTRTADSRIFQNLTVPDIIQQVFQGHGFNDFDTSGLSGTYQPREYCVQYRETDFNFVSRLMEQEGIYYFFKHDNGKHTLVLADSIAAHNPFPGYATVQFSEMEEGAAADREVITDWVMGMEVQPGAYSLNDFNYKTPKAALLSSASVTRQCGGSNFEIYDYPGEYGVANDGSRLAQARLDELQAEYEVLHGQTLARGIAAGCTFQMNGHPRQKAQNQNRNYLITGVSLHADAGEFSTQPGAHGEKEFSCSFTAIDKTQQFRPPRLTPKPIIQGPQTAFVVGAAGAEIDTDPDGYGCVRVQFHWDRYGQMDQNSSCWVRVSSTMAGKGWGAIALPRIGQEVIVEFLEGDPDRPIITGRVYNNTAMPPYLPATPTRSTFKSNSSKGGGGFNEIRFDDLKGSEQIFIHGEKDQDVRIKNDAKEWIGNDRHLVVKQNQLEKVEADKHSLVKGDFLSETDGDRGDTVKGGRFAEVDGDDHLTVKGVQNVQITGDVSLEGSGNINQKADQKLSIQSGQDFHEKAGQNYALAAGQNIHLKGGTTVVIEAGTQLSLKVGGNYVDIGPSGVSINGTMVNINSGGSPASGSGSSPTAPATPQAPKQPNNPTDAADDQAGTSDTAPQAPTPPQPVTFSATAVSLQQAAASGAPFCPTSPH
jgi:type VI secretion system secreted protein VgrG